MQHFSKIVLRVCTLVLFIEREAVSTYFSKLLKLLFLTHSVLFAVEALFVYIFILLYMVLFCLCVTVCICFPYICSGSL